MADQRPSWILLTSYAKTYSRHQKKKKKKLWIKPPTKDCKFLMPVVSKSEVIFKCCGSLLSQHLK